MANRRSKTCSVILKLIRYHPAMHEPLILASRSPQRQRLLDGIGVPFVVVPSQVNEEACTIADPKERAQVLAREKAEEVAERHRGRWVLGCDTLVVAPDGMLLEKPADAMEAESMLRLQSGGTSAVHSAIALIDAAGVLYDGVQSSSVRFRTLSEDDIAWWLATGLWEDRSGAFQIDGKGQLMIEEMTGDWTGVVGLPMFLLGRLMEKAGYVRFI
jgi:septum formation protein